MGKSCADFATEMAAKTSVPGGGGAAAYVGALSAALCSMAGNFTVGKKKYAEHERDVLRMLAEGEAIRARLLELVDEDARAFYPLAQAYAIPKEDPARGERLEECTKGAIAAPLETMRQVARAVELLEEMRVKGSRLLLSDVGCGAACAAAALQASSILVFVNTRSLKDRAHAAMLEAEADELLTYVGRAQRIANEVTADIRAL